MKSRPVERSGGGLMSLLRSSLVEIPYARLCWSNLTFLCTKTGPRCFGPSAHLIMLVGNIRTHYWRARAGTNRAGRVATTRPLRVSA
jgi:hypothetical protein